MGRESTEKLSIEPYSMGSAAAQNSPSANQANEKTKLSFRDIFSLGFNSSSGPKCAALSPLELQNFKAQQLKLGLKTAFFIDVMAFLLAIIVSYFVYVNAPTHQYLYLWQAIIGLGFIYLFSAIFILFKKNLNNSLSHEQFEGAHYLVPLINGSMWGLLPALLIYSFNSNVENFVGDSIFIGLMISSVVWAFPFIKLTLLMICMEFLAYSLANFLLLGRDFIFPYTIVVLYFLILCFIIFVSFSFLSNGCAEK